MTDNLNPQQFPRAYQMPLPGLEHIGANERLPVSHLFRHQEINPHPAEWYLLRNAHREVRSVPTTALRPTQPHINEGYLYQPSISEGVPGVIRDGSGRYRIVDGHHRVARSLLANEPKIDVEVYDSRRV